MTRFTILATAMTLSCLAQARGSVIVDLGQVVAGFNGSGQSFPGNQNMTALNPSTGQFVNGIYFGYNNHNGYQPVFGSPFVDGVFVMYPQTVPINPAGITYSVLPNDFSGQSFDYITNNREIGTNNPLNLGGLTYSSGIGICASGVTFNLSAIDSYYGTHHSTFSAIFGRQTGGSYTSFMRGYAVLSNDTGVLSDFVTPLVFDQTANIQLSIPMNAKYLTLIAGTGGDGIDSDHGGFGNARLTAIPEPGSIGLAFFGATLFGAVIKRQYRDRQ